MAVGAAAPSAGHGRAFQPSVLLLVLLLANYRAPVQGMALWASQQDPTPPQFIGNSRKLPHRSSLWCDSDDHQFRLGADSIVYSNLGGFGPHKNRPEGMRYTNVFPKSGHVVDLVVNAAGSYSTDIATQNDMHGRFAMITANPGSSTVLQFNFVENGTDVPFVAPGFLLTLANINKQKTGGGKMSVTAFGVTSYHLSEETSLNVNEDPWEDSFTFSPTTAHPELDKSVHPFSMPAEVEANAVTLQFPSLSEFELRIEVDQGTAPRTLALAGQGSLACPLRATCSSMQCPSFYSLKNVAQVGNAMDGMGLDALHLGACASFECTQAKDTLTCCQSDVPPSCKKKNSLTLKSDNLNYSNLGNLGPHFNHEEGILYKNVFPGGETAMDMLVESESSYVPGSQSNGIFGESGVVSIAGGERVDLRFSFFKHNTNNPVTVHHPFWFTIYDYNSGVMPNRLPDTTPTVGNSVALSGFDHFVTSSTTKVRNMTTLNGRVLAVFDSEPGRMPNREVNMLLADEAMVDRMMSVYYQGVRDFRVTFSVASEEQSHEFYFGGPTGMTCPTSGRCISMTCPVGYELIENADEMLCAGTECEESDKDLCCRYTAISHCDMSKTIRFHTASVLNNNLGGLAEHHKAPQNMVIGNVFPNRSRFLDLVITVDDGETYHADIERNSVSDGFLNIHVRQHTKLNFQLVDHETHEPATVDRFFLSFAGLQSHEGHGDAVTAYELEAYVLSPSTHVEVLKKGTIVQFRESPGTRLAMRTGIDPMQMTNDEQDGAVNMLYTKVSNFTLRLDTKLPGGSIFRFFGPPCGAQSRQ